MKNLLKDVPTILILCSLICLFTEEYNFAEAYFISGIIGAGCRFLINKME